MTASSTSTGYSLAVLLDEKRLSQLRGTGLEQRTTALFGGAIKAFILHVNPEQSQKLLSTFSRSRTDSRGFLEELPVTFKRALFEEIVRSKSVEPAVVDAVLRNLDAIQADAAQEENYLAPPELSAPSPGRSG